MRLFYKIGHERKYHDLAIKVANEIYLQLKQNEIFANSDNFFVVTKKRGKYLLLVVYHKDELGLYREIYNNKISNARELTYYDLCKFYYKSCLELMGAINNFILLTKYRFEVAARQKQIKSKINILRSKFEKL